MSEPLWALASLSVAHHTKEVTFSTIFCLTRHFNSFSRSAFTFCAQWLSSKELQESVDRFQCFVQPTYPSHSTWESGYSGTGYWFHSFSHLLLSTYASSATRIYKNFLLPKPQIICTYIQLVLRKRPVEKVHEGRCSQRCHCAPTKKSRSLIIRRGQRS